jgi:hypothetical protein
LNHDALGEIREGAGLEGDEGLARDRVNHLYVVGRDHLLLGHLVVVLATIGVLQGGPIPSHELVEVVEHVQRARVRISEAVPRDVDVRPILPRETRRGDVDGALSEAILGDGVGDGHAVDPELGNGQVHGLVLGTTPGPRPAGVLSIPELRRKLLGSIEDATGASISGGTSHSARIWGLFGSGGLVAAAISAVAVLAVVGLFLWNESLRGQNEDLRGEIQDRRTYELRGTGAARDVRGEVVEVGDGRAVLLAKNLPPPPEGEVYEA